MPQAISLDEARARQLELGRLAARYAFSAILPAVFDCHSVGGSDFSANTPTCFAFPGCDSVVHFVEDELFDEVHKLPRVCSAMCFALLMFAT